MVDLTGLAHKQWAIGNCLLYDCLLLIAYCLLIYLSSFSAFGLPLALLYIRLYLIYMKTFLSNVFLLLLLGMPVYIQAQSDVHGYPAAGAITIDGALNETAWKLNRSIGKPVTGTYNNTATFGVLWDNNNLYIGAKILDSTLNNDSPDAWNNDALEVFIDANNNKLNTYDGYDNQFIKGWNTGTLFSKTAITGAQHAWAAIDGGYTVEISIPWSQLGITPAVGTQIGLDVANDDDDNGGDRDAQAVWQGTMNNYQSTANFGTLVLESSATALVNNLVVTSMHTITDSSETSMQVVPNPVDNGYANVIIPGATETGIVKVFDMTGHLVYTTTGQMRIPLYLEALPKGMYLVQFVTVTKIMHKKLLID